MNSPSRPTRPKLADRYDRKQQQVVHDAARVFAERGFDQTTIQELARAIDLAAGGIYHYVGSKDRLLALICDQLMDPLLEQARDLLAREAGPVDQLYALVRLWVLHVAAHRDHMLVFQQRRHVIERGPQWREARAARKGFERLLEELLAAVHADGALSLADERLAVAALLGMVNHTAQWFRPKGRLSAEQVADGYVDLLLVEARRRPARGPNQPSAPAPQSLTR